MFKEDATHYVITRGKYRLEINKKSDNRKVARHAIEFYIDFADGSFDYLGCIGFHNLNFCHKISGDIKKHMARAIEWLKNEEIAELFKMKTGEAVDFLSKKFNHAAIKAGV